MAKPKRAALSFMPDRLGLLDTRIAQPPPKDADAELRTGRGLG